MPENDRYEDRPALDEIESRADLLMAKMAARRQPPQSTPDPLEPPEQGPAFLEQRPEHHPDVSIHDTDVFDTVDLIPEPSPEMIDDHADEYDESDEPQGLPRRMALPPWQNPPSPMGELHPGPDAHLPSRDASPPSGEGAEPPRRTQPPSSTVPPSGAGWPPGAPMPPANWQLPPPGWMPGLPPPPPGWQGMPPWLPPPEQVSQRPRGVRAPVTDDANDDRRTSSNAPRDGGASRSGHDAPRGFRVPPSLEESDVLGRNRNAPQHGWRRMVHSVTKGRINPGISRKERERRELLEQIQRPIVGDFRIAVLSIKGGVGKTATTLGLGSALATVRTDRVIAVDANPDRGTLAERVQDTSTASTVRDLLRDPDIKRYADVRNHTRMTASRLEVLASEQDPAVAEVFGETDYRQTMDILRQYYNVILTDCGTGIMHSAMDGVLDLAQSIVLVSSPAIDAALSASATLDWLVQHGYGALVRRAHVVFSASRPGSEALKLDKVSEHFEARCESVHVIPFEPHLAEGAEFDFGLLKPATARAYLELAGAVSEDFAWRRSADDVH